MAGKEPRLALCVPADGTESIQGQVIDGQFACSVLDFVPQNRTEAQMIEPDRKEQIPEHSAGDAENRCTDAYTTADSTDPRSAPRGRPRSGDHGGRRHPAGASAGTRSDDDRERAEA